MEVARSFVGLLTEFEVVFTAPSFGNFIALMTGWVLSHRRRFVTELIQSAGCLKRGHHSRYHRFFSNAAWSLDDLSRMLALMLVRTFSPLGLITLAVDDTLVRRRGLTLFGAGMHYDPLISSRSKKLVSWGHNWVVLFLVISCPAWSPTKVWSLPIAFRLYKNRQGNRKGNKKRPSSPIQTIALGLNWRWSSFDCLPRGFPTVSSCSPEIAPMGGKAYYDSYPLT